MLNAGTMPNTDFRYEEFEAMLASFYLTLQPLKDKGSQEDAEDFNTAVEILNRISQRHTVQSPSEAANNPRNTNQWAQPKAFETSFTVYDMLGSFIRDFGIVQEAGSEERCDVSEFNQLIIRILDRHQILTAEFEAKEGKKFATKIKSWNGDKQFKAFNLSLSFS